MLIADIVLFMAAIIILLAAIGLFRLQGALARQHAATKAGTLAISVGVVALALQVLSEGWGYDWVLRLLMLQVVLLITLPLASHALARSAALESTVSTREGSTRQD